MKRMHQLRIPVRDLGCGDTGRRGLERVLMDVEGVKSTYVNPVTETAYLEVDSAQVRVEAVIRAIADRGYRPGRPAFSWREPPHEVIAEMSVQLGEPSITKETLTMHEHHDEPQATDPVCGMFVAQDTEVRMEYRGTTYRFCDPACAGTFRDDPERWVGAANEPGFTHSHSH